MTFWAWDFCTASTFHRQSRFFSYRRCINSHVRLLSTSILTAFKHFEITTTAVDLSFDLPIPPILYLNFTLTMGHKKESVYFSCKFRSNKIVYWLKFGVMLSSSTHFIFYFFLVTERLLWLFSNSLCFQNLMNLYNFYYL